MLKLHSILVGEERIEFDFFFMSYTLVAFPNMIFWMHI